jgi:peptidase S24-like protein
MTRRDNRIGAVRRAVFAARRREGATAWIQASGPSMLPVIAPGSWLGVDFGATPRAGDVTLVPAGGRLVAHRVVRMSDGMLVTKGDAEGYADPPVSAADAIGVVRAIRRRGTPQATTRGLAGPRARALARVSGAGGRCAARARRAALRLPPAPRRAAMYLIPVLTRAPVTLTAALLVAGARDPAMTRGEVKRTWRATSNPRSS